MSKPGTTTLEARRQAAAVQRITGEWFCHAGAHYTKGEQLIWRGHRICARCQDRMRARTRKSGTP